MEKSFPLLHKGQVALIRFDLYIGIKLDINFDKVAAESLDVYSVFNSLEEALMIAEKIVDEYDFVECLIYDYNNQLIELIQPK